METIKRGKHSPELKERAVKLQKALEKLKSLEQQLILKQVDGLAAKR